jgi:hypothetical protein
MLLLSRYRATFLTTFLHYPRKEDEREAASRKMNEKRQGDDAEAARKMKEKLPGRDTEAARKIKENLSGRG